MGFAETQISDDNHTDQLSNISSHHQLTNSFHGIGGHGHSGHSLREDAETKQQKRPLSFAKSESAPWTPQWLQKGQRPHTKQVDQHYMIQLGTSTRPRPVSPNYVSSTSQGNEQWNTLRFQQSGPKQPSNSIVTSTAIPFQTLHEEKIQIFKQRRPALTNSATSHGSDQKKDK